MLTARPIGIIDGWPAAVAPEDYLLCQGQALSRSTYSALFGVIGTTFGIGDGSTTFNLPEARDRTLVGASGTKSLGSSGGASTVNLSHSHSVNSHSHEMFHTSPGNKGDWLTATGLQFTSGFSANLTAGAITTLQMNGVGAVATTYFTSNEVVGTSSSLSSSQSVQNPYFAANYIIRYV